MTVLGSLNMDIPVTVPCLPAPGATVLGSAAVFTPGGKGANQAVAVHLHVDRRGGREVLGEVPLQDRPGHRVLHPTRTSTMIIHLSARALMH